MNALHNLGLLYEGSYERLYEHLDNARSHWCPNGSGYTVATRCEPFHLIGKTQLTFEFVLCSRAPVADVSLVAAVDRVHTVHDANSVQILVTCRFALCAAFSLERQFGNPRMLNLILKVLCAIASPDEVRLEVEYFLAIPPTPQTSSSCYFYNAKQYHGFPKS